MVLSDRSIREALASGAIVIEPMDDGAVQPSSVDLHVDRYFRVFRNDTTPYIDPKQAQEDLTELVEVEEGGAFILHPGEFVLGSTLERVALGEDLVARLEGKSSLGRLGLLIHSSLPASEPVMILAEDGLRPRPIGEVVRERLEGSVVSFDPVTFDVGYHRITGWYEGPADRIYEVRLASGRRVRVTAGHNLFTLDDTGALTKTRTGELRPGTRVAVPKQVDDPPAARRGVTRRRLDLLSCVPDEEIQRLTITGPAVARAFEEQPDQVSKLLRQAGFGHVDYYRSRRRLPLQLAAQVPGLLDACPEELGLAVKQARHRVPRFLDLDTEFAWMLGLYVAEGYRRSGQFVIANTDQAILDRAEAVLTRLDIPIYREAIKITGCSSLFSAFLGWIGTGGKAAFKRIPPMVFGWPRELMEAFLKGLVDGDGSRAPTRTSVWTCSDGLVADLLLLAERLGRRAGACYRDRSGNSLWQVYFPVNEHKLLTSVPLPDRLLVQIRTEAGLSQKAASKLAGYSYPTDLCNIETRRGRDAVRLATLRRLQTAYARRPECPPSLARLDRLVQGGLLWDRVVEVRDTGSTEPIFDLEVRPSGRKVENFLAGSGGVFVSNTAGFVDAGWDGHLTLELSNVANLPIAIYPGMKIGQISFLRMTTEAESPYGSDATGSKYKGQRGPTPSRYYLNFPNEEGH